MEGLAKVTDKKGSPLHKKRWEKYYLVKTPLLLKKIYSSYLWNIDTKEKILYLTFDDGPHPEITPFVLRQLKRLASAQPCRQNFHRELVLYLSPQRKLIV